MRVLPLLLLIGCLELPGDTDGSVLTELQVVGVEVEPPQVRPGVPAEVTVTVVDPRQRGVEVLIWSCTDVGVGCFEQVLPDGSARPIDEWAQVGTVPDDTFTVTVEPPAVPEAALLEADEDDLAVMLWVVACAPGVCEVMDRVRANPEPGSPAWDVAARMLAWPDQWIGDLPTGWTSTGVKLVPVRSVVDNENPVLDGWRNEVEVPVGTGGEALEISVTDDEPLEEGADVMAFSTFGAVRAELSGPNSARIIWDVPMVVGRGEVYGVVHDGRGGVGVWRGDVIVTP